MSDIPITQGTGSASVATELVGNHHFQQIEVLGKGGASVLAVNPDGSIKASIIGIPTVIIGGSVTTIATAPANQSVSGAITFPAGSIATVVNPAGSVTTVIATAPPGSIMATTAPAGSVIAVIGTVTAPAGSVMTTAALAGSIMAVSGTFTTPAGSIQSITHPAGSVTGVRTDNASVITVAPAGSVLAVSGTFTTPAGSVQSTTTPAGSVIAVRTDLASVITTQIAGSVMGVRTDSASVITVTTVVGSIIGIIQAASIAGTYAEDAAHTSADKGLFVLQVRNDTMVSITSADGDYSPIAGGPVGETITANSPITKWISGTADLRVVLGTSVQVLAAQGASVFTYVTGVQVANMGPNSVLVTIAGGLGSILGYTIAPAGGGSNIIYPNALRTGENSKVTASISGAASVLVSAQGFIAKI